MCSIDCQLTGTLPMWHSLCYLDCYILFILLWIYIYVCHFWFGYFVLFKLFLVIFSLFDLRFMFLLYECCDGYLTFHIIYNSLIVLTCMAYSLLLYILQQVNLVYNNALIYVSYTQIYIFYHDCTIPQTSDICWQ